MKRYLLYFEFRYSKIPKSDHHSDRATKTVTIGVYDTAGEAVGEGNKHLDILSNTFDIRDRFKERGLFGTLDNLVTNFCTKDKVHFFAKITTLDFKDLQETTNEALESVAKYKEYIKNIDN